MAQYILKFFVLEQMQKKARVTTKSDDRYGVRAKIALLLATVSFHDACRFALKTAILTGN
jgi:hypothetical protein